MKASELVKWLQEDIEQYGDLEVTTDCDNIITGMSKTIVILGDGKSHFSIDDSGIDVNEFYSTVESYMSEGMNEEEARKSALEELEEYYS